MKRKEIFNNYGWDLLFFNEMDVNMNIIESRIGGGYYF